jgi:hypothetical protein
MICCGLLVAISLFLLPAQVASATGAAFEDVSYARMQHFAWQLSGSQSSGSEQGRAQETIRLAPVELVGPQTQLQPLIGTPVAIGHVESTSNLPAVTSSPISDTISSDNAH